MNLPVYLYVTPFFPSPNRWKYGYGYDFVKALIATGKYDVRVFMPYSKGGRDHGGALGEDSYDIKGIRVCRFKSIVLPSNVFPFACARWNQRNFIRAVLSEGIDLNDVAVCHGHTANFSIYPLAVKKRNRHCLTLLHHHDLQSFGLGIGFFRECWLYNMLAFPLFRHYHEQIDCHVFVSDLARRSFLSAPNTGWTRFVPYKKQMRHLPYRPVKIRRSIVLHNGVDATVFNRVPVRKAIEGSFVIGCIGNFIPCKDQLSLLKAVECVRCQIPGLKVVFVGGDVLRQASEEYARGHGLSDVVEFRSEVLHECLPDLYRSFDLFVLPSYFEGFGCVYTEAWSCGTPFIACKGSPMEEVLAENDRNHWLCNERDPDDLARLILDFYQNRRVQKLKVEVDLRKLVARFADQLAGMKMGMEE